MLAALLAVESPMPAAKAELRDLADRLVTAERPGDWAQALMDLGAMICRPRSPACLACPLSGDCAARATGAPETWPRKTAKAARPHRHGVVFVLCRGDAVALVQRPPKGLLGGMLGLPTTPWRSAPWTKSEALAHAPGPAAWEAAGGVTHVFTHFSLDLDVFVAKAAGAPGDFVWTPRSTALADTPSLFRKALERAFGDAT